MDTAYPSPVAGNRQSLRWSTPGRRALRARIMPIIFGAVIMASCATLPGQETTDANNPSTVQSQTVSKDGFGQLPAQNLAIDECGLFVWTGEGARQFIMFSQSSTQTAIWSYGGAPARLRFINEQDKNAQQQSADNVYETGSGTRVTLSLKGGEAISDGTRYPGGTLSFDTPEGWRMVVPVAGLSACQRRE